MTPWDRRLFVRALAGAAIAFAVVVLVTAATDAGGSFADRITASLPASPLASGAGAWVTLAGTRRARELVALEVTGVSPRRARFFAWLGATLPGVLLALAVFTPRVDMGVFYPDVRMEARWTLVTSAAGTTFESDDLGVAVTPQGALLLRDIVDSRVPASSSRAHRVATSAVLAWMAGAWALALAGAERQRVKRVAGVGIASLAIALLFQLVAAQRMGLVAFVVAALAFGAAGILGAQTMERAIRGLRTARS